SNVWITFAIREGKNREVRNVLRHLGLQVARLIRVSFGPFQLGELAEGAVAEVPTRILRDQLGERLAKPAGAGFTAPIVERKAEPEKAALKRGETRDEKPKGKDEEKGKPGRRFQRPEKRIPGRPLRGEGRRDTYDERDEAPTRPRSARPPSPAARG